MRLTHPTRQMKGAFLLPGAALALSACAMQDGGAAPAGRSAVPETNTASAATASQAFPHPGASIATMSDQYNRPRAGSVAAAGASAWVPPAPAPAFVLSEPLPPADAPAPPLAAVANRRPATPAQPASAPPPAATPAAPPVQSAASTADLTRGRALFNDWSCGTCHALADADASGSIGPSLDGNRALTAQSVAAIVTHGQGAMPGFGGQMTDEEIGVLAAYIVAAKK